jgi:hypothetical protein
LVIHTGHARDGVHTERHDANAPLGWHEFDRSDATMGLHPSNAAHRGFGVSRQTAAAGTVEIDFFVVSEDATTTDRVRSACTGWTSDTAAATAALGETITQVQPIQTLDGSAAAAGSGAVPVTIVSPPPSPPASATSAATQPSSAVVAAVGVAGAILLIGIAILICRQTSRKLPPELPTFVPDAEAAPAVNTQGKAYGGSI